MQPITGDGPSPSRWLKAASVITVTTADGRTMSRRVDDRKNLEGVKAGDRIEITYTQALVTAVEAGK